MNPNRKRHARAQKIGRTQPERCYGTMTVEVRLAFGESLREIMWESRPATTISPADLDQQELAELLQQFMWRSWFFPNGSSGREYVSKEWRHSNNRTFWVFSENEGTWKGVHVGTDRTSVNVEVDFGVHFFCGDTIPADLKGLVR